MLDTEDVSCPLSQAVELFQSRNRLDANGIIDKDVIDAIPGDGFNPLWREVQISFNEGFDPRQLTSDTDVEAQCVTQ